MFKKKKIREQFDEVFKSGDEDKIKEMLDEYPWLLEEVSSEMDEVMTEQRQIVAAVGVMEDELGGSVPLDEVAFSLRVDFDIKREDTEIQEALSGVENLGLIKREGNGWILTSEGGRVCDAFLNKRLVDINL